MKMVYPCLTFKATHLNFYALVKEQTPSKFFIGFLKMMLFCSISDKMASFLDRKYPEYDDQVNFERSSYVLP